MGLLKLSFCIVLLTIIGLTEQASFKENEFQVEILRIIPKYVNKIIENKDVQHFVDVLKKAPKGETVINKEADEFLIELNNYIISEGLDPVPLEDQGFEFQYKWLLITYSGEMTLKHGWLQGLGTLERINDCTMVSDEKSITLNLSLTFTDLLFNYDYTAKLMGIGPIGGIDGSIRDTKFTITVRVDPTTKWASLESYRLNSQGTMRITFTGHWLTDILANILSRVLTIFLWPLYRIFISNWVQDGVFAVLRLYNDSLGKALLINL